MVNEGLDYADQRFYASIYGRFNSPDPYQASGGPSDPGSWNRYTYTRGDPVNRVDPSGFPVVVTINNDLNGLWFSDSLLEQAQTLLHELGHAYQLLYGANSTLIRGPDGNSNDPTQAYNQNFNNTMIAANCTN